MPHNKRSSHVTQGVARSPNRSMYYALGYRKEDFNNPMVGIANGHSTITPCNAGLQKLADAAVAAEYVQWLAEGHVAAVVAAVDGRGGLVEVIAVTPAISRSRRSRGAATVAAIVSGSAPGRLAVMRIVGNSTDGRLATGRNS